jgi:5-formyltetrahydrofolate cyclo-ligase
MARPAGGVTKEAMTKTGEPDGNESADRPLQPAKSALRAQMRAELKKMSPAEQAADSRKICARLQAQPVWKSARAVLLFAPLPDEPDLWPLLPEALASGKTVCLPRFDAETTGYVPCQITNLDSDLRVGQFGIREPTDTCAKIPPNRLDLILAPGIAFDLNGYRLGRGKGFYDRLLAGYHGLTCGVAYDRQIVDGIPFESHDVRLNCLLTPARWHLVTGPRAVLK